jgi:ppGpp synthetase/RelA/SpoT-type nucleotidyltranferase
LIERTVEDRLRQQYFDLLPDVRRVAEELESEVRHCLLPVSLKLDRFERLSVTSRVKDCESAVDALRIRQEGGTFDREQDPASYTLERLNDLAGVRVLCFPRSRLLEADRVLRIKYPDWVPDPVFDLENSDDLIAYKYHGHCTASPILRAEVQIVPMLIGLFWQVEHSAIYKPAPQLKGIAQSLAMRERTGAVLQALKSFEDEFEALLQRNEPGIS